MGGKALGWRSVRADKAELTGSAASSSTQLLDPDLRSAHTPQLLNHLELVDVPDICVMCAAKDSQRAQRLAAPVTPQLAMAARPRSASRHDLPCRSVFCCVKKKIKIGKIVRCYEGREFVGTGDR